jgi:hypothetical protein
MKISIKFIASAIFLSSFMNPIALAQDTRPAPIGLDKPRNDAYLLKFQDSAVRANTSGYQSESPIQGSTRNISKRYMAVLPFCGNIHTFGCIEAIEIKDTTESEWERLTPGEVFWNHPIAATTPNSDGTRTEYKWTTWNGDSKIGLPPSGKVQVFNSIKNTHGGGSSYVVKSVISGNDVFEGKFSINQFNLSVIPIKTLRYDSSVVGSREIFSVENFLFPENIEFRITLRLGELYSQLNGWFFGRVDYAQINLDSKSQTLVVQGAPSKTPVQTGYMPYPVPERFKGIFLSTPNSFNGNLATYSFSPTNSESVNNWLKYKEYLNPYASYESEVWQIDAAPKSFIQADQDFQTCTVNTPGVTGLLTTNATAYVPKPPTWNSKDSSLTYQVAGPEFLSDGRTNRGSYLLALRNDVASCLWKTDLKNAKATVEVTNGDGTSGAQLATTTMSQRNGWLYFSASGFHFSAPTIKVKLTAPRMTTITCTKGKTSKKITAIKPTCPKGFKKKP